MPRERETDGASTVLVHPAAQLLAQPAQPGVARAMVRTYSSEGRRLADYTASSILHLEKRGRVIVKRNLAGNILSAKFLPPARRSVVDMSGVGIIPRVRFTQGEHLDERNLRWRVEHKPAA